MEDLDISKMNEEEKRTFLKRRLIESVVLDEQLLRAGDEKLEKGENYGLFTIKEFYEMHPDLFPNIDPKSLEDNPNIEEAYVAPFGENSYILINNGRVAGRCVDGNFTLSDTMIEEMKKEPVQNMVLLTNLGLTNDKYLEKYKEFYNPDALADRAPKSLEEYFEQLINGQLVTSKEQFADTLELSDEDREALDRALEEKDKDYEEKEDEEKEESKDVDELDSEIADESDEERARRMTEAVLRRYNVPARARDQLIDYFRANRDAKITDLKQVMEVKVPGDTPNKYGYALRFRSKDVNISDRIVVVQDSRVLDKRMYDSNIESKMDAEYAKAPVEVLDDDSKKISYTDVDGHTFTAEVKRKPKDLTRTELDTALQEFEVINRQEREIFADAEFIPPEEFMRRMAQTQDARLKVIDKYGIQVPEIRDEIKADKELSEEIGEKIEDDKSEEIEEDDDRVRGPYDPHHGMLG